MEKIKTWVLYCSEYQGGLVYRDREEALEEAKDIREQGNEAYVRVKYFTRTELENLPEYD